MSATLDLPDITSVLECSSCWDMTDNVLLLWKWKAFFIYPQNAFEEYGVPSYFQSLSNLKNIFRNVLSKSLAFIKNGTDNTSLAPL